MPYNDLADFLVNAPLYRVASFPEVVVQHTNRASRFITVPSLIHRTCETCGPTKWKLDSQNRLVSEGDFSHLRYQCRNCQEANFNVWIIWGSIDAAMTIVKSGQYPKLEIAIPKDFDEALGGKRALYLKGMTLRHNAYGIGALTYFRRLIEDTTDEMLELLEKSMEETHAEPTAIERLKEARKGNRFDDKVRIAAEVIPAHLRPGGNNPFGNLYELLSIGLHDLDDDECCDIVDSMDESLKFIYTRLKTHVQEAKAYEQAAKSLSAKVARFKGRGSK